MQVEIDMRHVARSLITSCAVLFSFVAQAQDRTLYVAGYGGSFEAVLRKSVFPAFEQAHHVHIAYVSGNSTDTLAKLQAAHGHPDIDVAIVDDGPMYQALSLGFCDTLKPGPHNADLYDVARIGADAVAFGIVGIGIGYNTEAFRKQGWAPPTSWADLADPKYRGKLAMPGIDNTYGLEALLMYARIAGGGVDDIEPGFRYMADRIAPNMDAFESSPGRMSELYQSGEIVAAVWGTSRVMALAGSGFPVRFVYPAEGTPALFITACTVKGARDSDDAQAFIDTLLSPSVQTALAMETGSGPVNKTVTLPDTRPEALPYGAEAVARLVKFDWAKINPQRDAWTKQWNRQVER
jgi:putative spermidine/putrescine transport system substrate-binding protein